MFLVVAIISSVLPPRVGPVRCLRYIRSIQVLVTTSFIVAKCELVVRKDETGM